VAPLETTDLSGLSSECLFVEVGFEARGKECRERLVAKLAPLGLGIFPEYDLEAQWRIQETLGRCGFPVPEQVGFEAEETWVGSTFIMMRETAGRIPRDMPPYCSVGWLCDESPNAQATVCLSATETLAELHRLDWRGLDLSFVARPEGAGLVGELLWWDRYLQWASDGAPQRELSDVLAWCQENRPDPEPEAALCWGDARIGNMIFGSDLRPRALLDWEMASLCPPELDLGFFLSVRAMMRDLTGAADPELPGFPNRKATIAHYERRLGRAVQHLPWYEIFSMYRTGSIIVSMKRLLSRAGLGSVPLEPVPDWVLKFISSHPHGAEP
jgi:aminoglycoside phosphotransferase (APT) family kinase protein